MFSKRCPDILDYSLKNLESLTRKNKEKRIGNYIVSKTASNDLFTDFRHYSLQQSLSTGWKAYLSILPEQLSESYQSIVSILLKYEVLQFKFSDIPVMKAYLKKIKDNEDFVKDIERLYYGMQVSIYMQNGQECLFNEMLAEIEFALTEKNILPGIISSSDRTLGKYSSVRHQGTREYTSSQNAESYNPEKVYDPFIKLEDLQESIHRTSL
ncbi:hypothetical protein Lnau_2846 [Legionella nautarum]|uniref:Uncharacterized protein n=1 Tax=Legionella nautarum TaxID=45070 RepID=A0A0W0WLK4_9GAMM|nr:hypothetical protein [Legionella nautarum]KTD33198.1 hypothetical protein Lnau_2846 [Legionella nautarum]